MLNALITDAFFAEHDELPEGAIVAAAVLGAIAQQKLEHLGVVGQLKECKGKSRGPVRVYRFLFAFLLVQVHLKIDDGSFNKIAAPLLPFRDHHVMNEVAFDGIDRPQRIYIGFVVQLECFLVLC